MSIEGRSAYIVRCASCFDFFTRQSRIYAKAIMPNLCNSCGRTEKRLRNACKCELCGAVVSRRYGRCKKCSAMLRGETCPATGAPFSPVAFCVSCKTLLKSKSASRCLPCHNINQDKGLSNERVKFNASQAWAALRRARFERDGYTCQCCGTTGGELNAHHIKPYSSHPASRLDIKNLITLCRGCHMRVHHGKDEDLKKRFLSK